MTKKQNISMDAVIKNLEKNDFRVISVDTPGEAKSEVIRLVLPGESVGVGGSMTIRAINVLDGLASAGYKIIHHWIKLPEPDVCDARRSAVRADVYLTSTNAITENGELVNMDTYGNRASAMIYGPEKVIIVAGRNKIVKDIDAAFKKIRKETAVKNAERIGVKDPAELCKVGTVIYKRPNDTDITVILVNEDLGF